MLFNQNAEGHFSAIAASFNPLFQLTAQKQQLIAAFLFTFPLIFYR